MIGVDLQWNKIQIPRVFHTLSIIRGTIDNGIYRTISSLSHDNSWKTIHSTLPMILDVPSSMKVNL